MTDLDGTMTKKKIDPLTIDSLVWLRENSKKQCDCFAAQDPSMMHSNFCAVSPIYAAMFAEFGDPRFVVFMTYYEPKKAPYEIKHTMIENYLKCNGIHDQEDALEKWVRDEGQWNQPGGPCVSISECSCASTEMSFFNCPVHGENAPEH